MVDVKKPQDRKTAKPAKGVVVVRGLSLNVPADAKDDFELLDDLAAFQNEKDGSRLPRILRKLVGDQFTEVMDSLRGENGRVSVKDGFDFVKELIGALNPNS